MDSRRRGHRWCNVRDLYARARRLRARDSTSNAISFLPTDLGTSRLRGYLQPDAGNITVVTGDITAESELSGLGRNLTSAGGSRPTVSTADASYNNRSTRHHVATQYDTTAVDFTFEAQPFTIVTVGHCSAVGTQVFLGNSATSSEIDVYAIGGNMALYAGSAVIATAVPWTSPCVRCDVVNNGGTSSIYKNDHTTPVATGTTGTAVETAFRIGAAKSGGSGWIGTTAGMAFLSGAASANVRGAVMGYFGWYYNLPVT
jgi:hypothetical protein